MIYKADYDLWMKIKNNKLCVRVIVFIKNAINMNYLVLLQIYFNYK